jgi:predicted neuraminidase
MIISNKGLSTLTILLRQLRFRMITTLTSMFIALISIAICRLTSAEENEEPKPIYSDELIFPLHPQHNHAPGIAELANGELLVSWYRGSGERSADDVAVWGARQNAGSKTWSEAFLMADTPGFPDCNTCLMTDTKGRLWLFWPVILANSWESCITRFRVSENPIGTGCPKWNRDSMILLKPDNFQEEALKQLEDQIKGLGGELTERRAKTVEAVKARLGEKLLQRLGWQPRCKPTVLPSGRILLPLYTDTYSLSIMAISDDEGENWVSSKPLFGFGAIQPTVLRRDDGTLVAYMRENGYTGFVRQSESKDEGLTWGTVGVSSIPNPGSGLDGIRLANGHWILICNDTKNGRNRLTLLLSDDQGLSWKTSRSIEDHAEGSYHYPAIMQSKDGMIHVVYSYFVKEGKSMKHASFNEAWIGTSR